MNLFFFILILAVCVSMISCPVFSQWSSDSDINTPVCRRDGYQGYPRIVPDGSGGTIIVWADQGDMSGNNVLYAQRLSASGESLWPIDGIPVTPAGREFYFELAPDNLGGVVVVWYDKRSDSTDNDIFAQRIGGSGSLLWDSSGVQVCAEVLQQIYPVVCVDDSGESIIAWMDARGADIPSANVYAQRLSASGNVLWQAEGIAICTADNLQNQLRILSDDSSGAYIVWSDGRNFSYWNPGANVYAQRVNRLGSLQWASQGYSVCPLPTTSQSPRLVSDGIGGMIVTWEDWRKTTTDIYAQRISPKGLRVWDYTGVRVSPDSGNYGLHRTTSDGWGGVIVVWQEDRGTANNDIFAQRISSEGIQVWDSAGVPVCIDPGNQLVPVCAPDGNGGAVFAWSDGRSADIYAQRVDSSGITMWTANGIAVSSAVSSQDIPEITNADNHNFVITWVDSRNGYGDIYAQKIHSSGTLTNVGITHEMARDYRLYQNYPNPFNPTTTITYELPYNSNVSLRVYNLLGQLVETLLDGFESAGIKSVEWDASNTPSGVYFYRLTTDHYTDVKFSVIVK